MKRTTILLIILITSLDLFSQEICDNGIDDDGNGLIDLQDTACSCRWGSYDSIVSLIPNYSFEDTFCCPSFPAQVNCATNWLQASPPTSDYFNLCGISHLYSFKPPPIPIADGQGYVGFIDGGRYKEYVGICLSDTLYAGVSYKLKFELAFSRGSDSLIFSLFGTNNCSNLPFGTSPLGGCPSNFPNWTCLDSNPVFLDTTKWNQHEFSFTPIIDMTVLVLGPNCANSLVGINYYYLDNLILNKSLNFAPKSNIVSKGNLCQNQLELIVNFDSIPNSIQWYRNNIAILGETNINYYVPKNSSGAYQVKLLYDSGCIIKEYKAINEALEIKFPNVFSPNQDNINDLFEPVEAECLNDFIFQIYNRWGQIVYETNSLPISWDGTMNRKKCSEGVYFWVLKPKNSNQKLNGNISLFR